ncbi:netrin-G1 isoform X6 [Ambystoma mexicanum]|uniref:netrin-G1 isoform X6 n=1 Tax=Ambystoma mexicanum TaxID=8296 RepID=UPI0037E8A458
MYFSSVLWLQALWASLTWAMQHYPSEYGHYDVCKSLVRSDEGIVWEYMACQPESTDMTKYLKVRLDPPDSTCGESPEKFCAMGNPYMCNNECDASTPELAHPTDLMFDFEGRNPSTFWQSITWKNYPRPLQVNITLSWNKTIELTDNIAITFESGRPEKMILEKSLDYGRTWQPYQFYAADCLDAFRMEPKSVKDLSHHTVLDIICTEEYSTGYAAHAKTISFEIKDRFAIFAGPRLHNMASLYSQLDTTKNLRDFFTVTDLRIRLLRPATGATFVDEQNLARYFYAISDIKIHGRCKCNLHANTCVFDNNKLSCECEHNTTGPDCGRCRKNYQGRPWSPGSYLTIPKGTANICTPSISSIGNCECNGHSNRCTYIDLILAVVCVNCKHNTRGQQCQSCRPGYFRNTAARLDDENVCIANVCDNELQRCQNGGICHRNMRCECAAPYTGILCEKLKCEKESGGCGTRNGQGAVSRSQGLALTALLGALLLTAF